MKHLIIDGYNLIHGVPEWRSLLQAGDPAPARDALFETARLLHDTEGIQVTVVYDGSSEETRVEYPSRDKSLAIVFAESRLSADGCIERLARAAVRENAGEVLVCSRDNMIRESARASGGFVLEAEDLLSWAARARERISRVVRGRKQDTRLPGPFDELE